MINLILVRHGQSEWNLENRLLTWVCFSLGWVVILYPFFMKKDKD